MKTKTILGLLLGTAIIYNELQKKRDTPPIYIRKKLRLNYNGRTIPPFGIYITEAQKDNKALLEHELVHWRQYQQKGLIRFYFDYAGQLKKHGYDQMPMEKEARVNESDYCKENYTECVRNGTAKTVHNPNFREGLSGDMLFDITKLV